MHHLKLFVTKKAALYILVAFAMTFAAGTYWYMRNKRVPNGYVLVKSYRQPLSDGLMCAAILPTCGDCTGGKVIQAHCYVPKGSSYDGL